MAIGEKNVAFAIVQLLGPNKGRVGVRLLNLPGVGRHVANVPVPGQQRIGVALLGIHTRPITDVRIGQRREVLRRGTFVRRTNQNPRRAQFIRHDQEMMKGEGKHIAQEQRFAVMFHGTTLVCRELHRQLAIMIIGKEMKAETHLLQVAQARGLPGLGPSLAQSRQQQPRQDRNDSNDNDQAQARRTRDSRPQERRQPALPGAF